MNKNLGLIPLWNFGEIVPNLYRSAQPQWKFQYEWLLKNLGVGRIVNIRKESQHDQKIVVDIKYFFAKSTEKWYFVQRITFII